jgi:hypothetical protein
MNLIIFYDKEFSKKFNLFLIIQNKLVEGSAIAASKKVPFN